MLLWQVKQKLLSVVNALHYAKNKVKHKKSASKHTVLMYPSFDGLTGGSLAFYSIAEMISKFQRVELFTHLSANRNKIVKPSINLIVKLKENTKYDLIIVDDTTDATTIKQLKYTFQCPVIVSCHCLLHHCHGRKPSELLATLDASDHIHFVDTCQLDDFQEFKDKATIIPNRVEQVGKTLFQSNLGSVGNFNEERKNLNGVLRTYERTNAEHLFIFNYNQTVECSKPVTINRQWISKKEDIYNNIDVFVFLSTHETFGLVVAEALSAGIPCVISNIAAFQHYKRCDAVKLVDHENVQDAAHKINETLKLKEKYNGIAKQFWEDNYSDTVISKKWNSLVSSKVGEHV